MAGEVVVGIFLGTRNRSTTDTMFGALRIDMGCV